MKAHITVRYEHRTIAEVNLIHIQTLGEFALPKGTILKKTQNGGKFKYYTYIATRHEVYGVPAENVGVFRITRTVTEKEELV